ncbi:MAG TPA: type II secretion system protein N [Ramlibacter sp.]|uniref:type II secretion system protein N n=1 Tax=Ramlibacter sp. TaxID=1917967 RepID=UPI002CE98261|nr:type II secretion system protein N [Ramlibacter sp.]HVZ44262.1 type II secretion system protein N [Ramlibacter sp.]
MARTKRPAGSARTALAPAGARWAAFGAIAGVLAATLLFAPAQWLAAAVRHATRGQIVLAEPRGTVWNGSAQLVMTGGAGSADAAALPGRLDWTLRPRLDGAAARLSAACCTAQPIPVRLHARLAGARLEVGDGTLHVAAIALAGLGTPWNTLQLEGELLMSSQALSVEWVEGRLAIAGRAELVAQNLSSRLSTLRPMGSYRITLAGGAVPTVRLDTLEGALRLTGSGQWVGQRLHFAGEASAAEPKNAPALENLLNILGRRNGPRSMISIG